jgi:hypothetical protein
LAGAFIVLVTACEPGDGVSGTPGELSADAVADLAACLDADPAIFDPARAEAEIEDWAESTDFVFEAGNGLTPMAHSSASIKSEAAVLAERELYANPDVARCSAEILTSIDQTIEVFEAFVVTPPPGAHGAYTIGARLNRGESSFDMYTTAVVVLDRRVSVELVFLNVHEPVPQEQVDALVSQIVTKVAAQ